MMEVISPVSTASLPAADREDLVFPAAAQLGTHLLGHAPVDVEHRRAVGERRHADVADVLRQERSAAGQRISAAARASSPREARRRRDQDDRGASSTSVDHHAHELAVDDDHLLHGLAFQIFLHVRDRRAPASGALPRRCRPAPSAASRDLAVHLHRHHDLARRARRLRRRPASRPRPRRRHARAAPRAPRPCAA